jgi:signal transduction histidine kinase
MTWHYAYAPYIWPTLATGVFAAALASYGWRRRSIPGARPFIALMAFGVVWVFAIALQMAATDIAHQILWYKLQSFCQIPTASAGLWFALEYAGLRAWLGRRTLALLSIPPVLFILLGVTNGAHRLLWLGFSSEDSIRPARSLATWIFIGYGSLLATVIFVVFIWLFFRSPAHRLPVALCLCGETVARVTYVLRIASSNPALTEAMLLAFTFAASMYALALFRYRMLDLLPMARGAIMQQMLEGMLVLDDGQRVVDLNPAAERILGLPAARVKGKLLTAVLPEFSLDEPEITLGAAPEVRHYGLHNSTLKDRSGVARGALVLLHDITEQKRAQAQILEHQSALATLRERDRVGRELHDGVAQVLAYIKMQGEASREFLDKDQPSEANRRLARLVAAAQDAHADVREYILGASAGTSSGAAFLPSLERYLRRFSENYGIAAKLSASPELTGVAFEPMVEAQLLRMIQEALTNVRKHSRARTVDVRLSARDGYAEAIVQDDGAGFDPSLPDATDGRKFGLRFMRERAEEVGGSVRIQSAPGAGAQVVICIPLRKGQS